MHDAHRIGAHMHAEHLAVPVPKTGAGACIARRLRLRLRLCSPHRTARLAGLATRALVLARKTAKDGHLVDNVEVALVAPPARCVRRGTGVGGARRGRPHRARTRARSGRQAEETSLARELELDEGLPRGLAGGVGRGARERGRGG